MNRISGIVSATKNALIPFTVPIACCSAIRESIAIADSDNNRLLYKILNKLMEIVDNSCLLQFIIADACPVNCTGTDDMAKLLRIGDINPIPA